jgi:hypothetical protein
MDKWRVGDDTGSKETDGCPLTEAERGGKEMDGCPLTTTTRSINARTGGNSMQTGKGTI